MYYVKRLTKTERSDSRGKFFYIDKKWIGDNLMLPRLDNNKKNDCLTMCIYDHLYQKKVYSSYIYHNSAVERFELQALEKTQVIAKYIKSLAPSSNQDLIKKIKKSSQHKNQKIKNYIDLKKVQLRNEHRIYYPSIEEGTYLNGDIVIFKLDHRTNYVPSIHLYHLSKAQRATHDSLFKILDESLGKSNYKIFHENSDIEKYYREFPKQNFNEFTTHINIPKFSINEPLELSKNRNRLFRDAVISSYGFKCAITEKVISYRKHYCLDAAHIKPFSDDGPCDLKNGLALGKEAHWLFDYGYLTIRKKGVKYFVEVHEAAPEEIAKYKDKELCVPMNTEESPSKDYLDYHADKIFGRFTSLKVNA